jgi:hypothetical protein
MPDSAEPADTPRFDQAIIEATKVRDYLLSPAHPVGRFKATVFAALGYTQDDWKLLAGDLLEMARTNPAVPGQSSAYGRKYEVSGILKGPFGRSARFVSVWLVRSGEDLPRLITVFPG